MTAPPSPDPAVVASPRPVASRAREPRIQSIMLVLLALGPEAAAAVLAQFSPEEISRISEAAGAGEALDVTALDAVARDLRQDCETGARFIGSSDEIAQVLASAPPREKGDAEVNDETPNVWDGVMALAESPLRSYVEAQHPQAQAFILARLHQEKAAGILAGFLAPQRNDIMMRMLSLSPVPDVVRTLVEDVLRGDLVQSAASGRDQHRNLAGLINRLDQQQSRDVIDYIADLRPTDAGIVKRYLFQFDDLALLPTKSLSLVVDRVATEAIIVALQGADPAITSALLAALAPRARRLVEAELQSAVSASPRDIADARRQIASAVLTLVAAGAIALPDALAPM